MSGSVREGPLYTTYPPGYVQPTTRTRSAAPLDFLRPGTGGRRRHPLSEAAPIGRFRSIPGQRRAASDGLALPSPRQHHCATVSAHGHALGARPLIAGAGPRGGAAAGFRVPSCWNLGGEAVLALYAPVPGTDPAPQASKTHT